MSDRLPGKKSDYPKVGVGGATADPCEGKHGTGVNGASPSVGEPSPGLSFLRNARVLGKAGGVQQAGDLEFESRYPAVWEYMTTEEYQGRPRATSTMLFFREDGGWKVCFADRENDCVLFRSGESFLALLAALEGALCSPRADWRASKRKR